MGAERIVSIYDYTNVSGSATLSSFDMTSIYTGTGGYVGAEKTVAYLHVSSVTGWPFTSFSVIIEHSDDDITYTEAANFDEYFLGFLNAVGQYRVSFGSTKRFLRVRVSSSKDNVTFQIGIGITNPIAYRWIQVAPRLSSQNVLCMAVFNEKLYAGTQTGGRLFEWNGTNAWVQKAPELNSRSRILHMCVHNNELYAIADVLIGGGNNKKRLYKWNGTNAWVQLVGDGYDMRKLIVYNNELYGFNTDKLYKFNNVDDWVEVVASASGECILYDNKLYMCMTSGELYEFDDIDTWVKKADAAVGVTSVNNMCISDGELYLIGNTATKFATLLKYNGVDAWDVLIDGVEYPPHDGTGIVYYEIFSYDNKVYCLYTYSYSKSGILYVIAGGGYAYTTGNNNWLIAGTRSIDNQEHLVYPIVYNDQLYSVSLPPGSGGTPGRLYRLTKVET
jgi:hypothetical protein